MKALSLWQPWASLLAHGKKRVETRGWALRHRGPLLVHASKRWSPAVEVICQGEPFRSALMALGYRTPQLACASNLWIGGVDAPHSDTGPYLPGGAIVGRVNVLECIPTADVRWADHGADFARIGMGGGWQFPADEKPFGDFSAGRFAILCDGFTPFAQPIPYRGMQGLFDVPDHLVAEALA